MKAKLPMTRDLVLIPGLNNTRVVFDGVVAALPAHLTAHALDCPAIPTVEGIAAALLPHLPERFWLVGFSFGGYVAMALLEAIPERIAGIALVCTGPHADRPERVAARRKSIDTVRQGNYLAMVEAAAPNTMSAASLARADLMPVRRKMVEDYGPERYLAHAQAAIDRPDRGHLLDGSRPTLFVGASDDKVFAPELVQACAAEVPAARLIMINGSGHLVPMEQPAALAAVLADWIAAAPPADA